MKKKNDNNNNEEIVKVRPHRSDFKIFQYVKLKGIRQANYKSSVSRFISPIFGKRVPDKTIIPEASKDFGDKDKRYEAFRSKPKLTKEEKIEKYGSEYYEFTNIIHHKSRTDFLGGKIVEEDPKEEQLDNNPKVINPIGFDFKEKVQSKSSQSPFIVYPDKPKIAESKPFEVEEDFINEPTPETFQRSEDITFTSSFAFETDPVDSYEPTKKLNRREERKRRKDKVSMFIPPKEYVYPPISMFAKVERNKEEQPKWLKEQIDIINQTLKDFAVEGEVIGSTKGPTVTRYELSLKPGVNVNRVLKLSDNLMMSLRAPSIRIEAPIPGKPYVGLEVPNVEPELVAFGNVIDDDEFLDGHTKPLKVALGVDIDGDNVYIDIASMPHGLIAGATNSGKSVTINTMLVSLLIKNSPEDLKLILIDPKMVELAPYNDLPHLITPVITDARMAAQGLEWAVEEMEKRYQLFADNKSRDIKTFNDKVAKGQVEGPHMPYIVIVIDELADLMMVAANEVEDSIQRITQKARAAGIHLLVATQRPTTDIVKGTIKSNIPSRIAFKVASHVDSTTILDGAGAEKLLGKGDMLIKGIDRHLRLQGAYIPDKEIYAVTDFIRANSETNYQLLHEELTRKANNPTKQKDELFYEVARYVVLEDRASMNQIQQAFSISFNRASSIVDMLEAYGIVSDSKGTRARDVLVTINELDEVLNYND